MKYRLYVYNKKSSLENIIISNHNKTIKCEYNFVAY